MARLTPLLKWLMLNQNIYILYKDRSLKVRCKLMAKINIHPLQGYGNSDKSVFKSELCYYLGIFIHTLRLVYMIRANVTAKIKTR